MSYQITNPVGAIEAVIDDNGSLNKFYSIANTLANELKVKFFGKQDDFDTLEWHFKYKGSPLKLLYNIYNGVSIMPQSVRDNALVQELAGKLSAKAA